MIWPIDDHTRAKHEILRRYLQAWFPIMTKYNDRLIVLDGFAGPGEYMGGEIGSPLIAIDTLLDHFYDPIRQREVVFLFIEKDPDRYENLKQLLSKRKRERKFPTKVSYQVFQGSFNETMIELLTRLEEQQWRLAPTFAFIDPFGYSHTPMSIISRLMHHPKCEVLITFMYEEINRFLTADYKTKEFQYDELFGTQDWRLIASTLKRRYLHNQANPVKVHLMGLAIVQL